jgi:hypothetical protein
MAARTWQGLIHLSEDLIECGDLREEYEGVDCQVRARNTHGTSIPLLELVVTTFLLAQ